MSEIGYLSKRFWTDPYITSLPPQVRFVYANLITNSNFCGVFEVTVDAVALQTGLEKLEVHEAFKRLEADKKIRIVEAWIGLKNKIKNQKLSENLVAAMIKELRKGPPELAQFIFFESGPAGLTERRWVPEFLEVTGRYIRYQKKRFIEGKIKTDPFPNYLDTAKGYTVDLLVMDIGVMDEFRGSPTLPLPKPPSNYNLNSKLKLNSKLNLKNCSPTPPDQTVEEWPDEDEPVEPVVVSPWPSSQAIEELRQEWNSLGLPECRRLAVNFPNLGEILESCRHFSRDEIVQAMKNFKAIIDDPENFTAFPFYPTFPSFMGKGIDMYFDQATPFLRCKNNNATSAAQAGSYDGMSDEEYLASLNGKQRK